MESNVERLWLHQNPAKKSPGARIYPIQEAYQEVGEKVNKLIPEKVSSPMISGGIKNENTLLRVAYRKGEKVLTDGSEKIANFGKKNFLVPPVNAQINTPEVFFLGKVIETDYEMAKKTGGLIIPKIFRTITIGSYIGTWLDTALMPTGIPDLVWKFKQKVIVPPLLWGARKIDTAYRKTKRFLGIRSKRKANNSWYTKTTAKISKLKSWVNEKISFRKNKISPLAEKNRKYFEKIAEEEVSKDFPEAA